MIRTALLATALAVMIAPAHALSPRPPMPLECGGPLFGPAVTHADLEAQWGKANAVFGTVPGPEGIEVQATVLFGNDPGLRAQVWWSDEARRASPSFVFVDGAYGENSLLAEQPSLWRGPMGIRLGMTLAEVEVLNGKPFMLYGFGWDYGGTVSSWEGGALAPSAPACSFIVRFDAQAPTEGALGDGEFASGDAAVRAAEPRVSRIAISYAPPGEQ